MVRALRLGILLAIGISGCGGGGGGSSTVETKDGPATHVNIEGPKNAANPEVTGTNINLSRAEESANQCQGGPPILPDPQPDTVVADLPQDPTPVTDQEVADLPTFPMQGFGHVTKAVMDTYPQLELTSETGTRVIVDSMRLTYAPAPGGRAVGDLHDWLNAFRKLSPPERIVALKYPIEALACQFAADEANSKTEEVFPGHKWDEDNTRGNAFRHMYWNMLMSYRGSVEFAEAMATAHEVPLEGEDADAVKRHNMDLHNNLIGRLAYYSNRGRISNETDLLAMQFEYVGQHPYEWFDGRPHPETQAPVYMEPAPEPPAPGDIVVSESDTTADPDQVGFCKGGPSKWWWESNYYGQGSHMFWTYSNSNNIDNWGLWRPNLPQGRAYEVYAYIPGWYASTKNAVYEIHYAGAVTTRTISQYDIYDRWESLGTYSFEAGTAGHVVLRDNTGEPVKARWVGFDSLKWVAR